MSLAQFSTPRINNSLEKLGKTSSQPRFRIKSMARIKTIEAEQQKCVPQIDYELELNKKMYTSQFLKQLFVAKSGQVNTKTTNSMYQAYLKTLSLRILNTNNLKLSACNFQKQSAQIFLTQFIKINNDISCFDLSQCAFLSDYHRQSVTQWIIQKIIKQDKRIVKLILRNLDFAPFHLDKVFSYIVASQKIFQLDLSNENSQTMNRFGDSLSLLNDFLKNNSTVGVLKLDNMSLRKQGVQQIYKGVSANVNNPLKILSLKHNSITEHASLYISLIARSGLTHLDLSENPLGAKFYLSLPSWKQSTIKNLALSNTNMNSESLIFFLTRFQQNKHLQHLKLDRNDFSSNWFNQMKEILQVNTSIESLSLVDCKIKRMTQAFVGMLHNRYLKFLNLSLNQFQEGIKQLSNLIKQNKILSQLRIRFCGLKQNDFQQIFSTLIHNCSISFLDISQNQLGEEGAKQLIKVLNRNTYLTNLVFQKVQISFATKQEILQKLALNKEIKRNRQNALLKKENKLVKRADSYTWNDVQQYQQLIKKNQLNIQTLVTKVNALQRQYDRKKHRFQQILKQCFGKQQLLSKDIDDLKGKIKNIDAEQKLILKKFKVKQDQFKKAIEKEQVSIANLQIQIKQHTTKNKKRENQLEDQHQNLKYIQKKKQEKKEQLVKLGFDTSTAVNSKRKSKNI